MGIPLLHRISRFASDFRQDTYYGLRLLVRAPGFAFLTVLVLAFGIGATGTIFSFVNSLVLRPLAIEDVGSIVQIAEQIPGEMGRQRVAYPNFLDWQEQSGAFAQIAAFRFDSLGFAADHEPEPTLVLKASATIFPLLRSRLALGRTFTAQDDRPDAPSVVVLSNAFWQNHFGSDPNVIGRNMRLDGHAATVVGVLAADPDYFGLAKVWTPLALARDANGRTSHFLSAVARLKRGVTIQQSQTELDTIASRMTDNRIDGRQLGVLVVPFQTSLVDFIYPALYVAMGAAGFLLLITCANVGNVVLARGTSRKKEIAIRMSLGASRYRIVRQLLVESGLLCSIAAAIGLGLCRFTVSAIVAMSPDNQRLVNIVIDWHVVGFVIVIAMLTSIGFGLLPALRISQPARFMSGHRARNVLVVSEVALTLVLVVGASLLLKSYARVDSVSPGMRTQDLVTFDLSLPRTRYPANPDISSFYSRALQAVTNLPGVESAATAWTLPFSGRTNFAPFQVKGAVNESPDQSHEFANQQIVSVNYFATADVKILSGRSFTDHDGAAAPRVAIINQALARRFWQDRNPIGEQIRVGPPEWNQPWLTVVGVSQNVLHYGLDQKVPLEIYQPFDQVPIRDTVVFLHTRMDQASLAQTLRQKIFEIDRDQAVPPLRSIKEVINDSLWQRRTLLSIMILFGSVALILSSMGLYGVIAYSVQQRQTEFGIRIALGAQRHDILKLAIGEGIRLACLGIVIGVVLASIAARTVTTLLYDVGSNDPAVFAATVVLLGTVVVIAAYIPARRANVADTITKLRADQ
jgi:putative ABC transport system permease protein